MQIVKNTLIPGSEGRQMAIDIFYKDEGKALPVVIYAHGFNGFKDWGNFDLIAKAFASAGYVLVKFNFSHNGTTPSRPEDFADLEAFGNNNYTKQLFDLGEVISWVSDPLNKYIHAIDSGKIFLIGHSMGGGVAVLKAAEDTRIKKLITWAGISECKTPWGGWPPERIVEWKQSGVEYYLNSRTNQKMPLYYQLYLDYQQNQQRLNISSAIKKLNIPVLICHGTLDNAVPLTKALALKAWQPAAELYTVESDHVFGRKHPWLQTDLPAAMQAVVSKSLEFLK
ncbi:MAG: alpha/beta fold hydrolase [Aquabacterium sp.]|nr:alpha/beta fold hydrolase [Ferruginibacter sp.]